MKKDAFLTRNDENTLYECAYFHNPLRWNENTLDDISPLLDEKKWSDFIKYMDEENQGVSAEINNLPNNKGGVYLFFIRGITIPFVENYIAYIGRAKYTDHQNIQKRAKEYFRETKKKNPRPKVERLFKYWKDYLYFRYFPCEDNDIIDRSENSLIRSLLPPFNDEIPDKIEFKEPENAF